MTTVAAAHTDLLAMIEEARQRIYALVEETPITPLPKYPHTFAKREELQKTGSFKLRGATNKLMSLSPQQAAAGVVTSSTGNHGLAVATAAKFFGIDAEVVLSAQVPGSKKEKNCPAGARIPGFGSDPG